MVNLCLEETELLKNTASIASGDHYTFIDIDRDEEDKDVALYQKTGDEKLFEKIYKNRVPTLQVWAKQYHYLMDSKEDAFCELSKYFAKAVKEYNRSKGSFNTCLFTFLINRVRNLNVGRNAKKRKPQFLDPDIKQSNFLYSLEYSYRDDKNDGSSTLKDLIADPKAKKDQVVNGIALEETIDSLSHGCPTVKNFLRKISNGDTLSSIIKESKMQKGNIKVSRQITERLKQRKSKKLIKQLIKDKLNLDKFSIVDYRMNKNVLCYTIALNRTKESSIILSAIRKFRKNKSFFISKMHE